MFRLTPGQVTTIGRAPTNRIVIRDEICSRNHCEVFQSGQTWTLRDLGSRNGTQVNGQRIEGDWELAEGHLVQIGPYDLGFTYDISTPFPRFGDRVEYDDDTATAIDVIYDDEDEAAAPEIIHRQRDSRFHVSGTAESLGDEHNRVVARLYRLAIEMGSSADTSALTDTVLRGLLEGVSADIGAILLTPQPVSGSCEPGQLHVVAYKGRDDLPYQRVSDYLSGIVLSEQNAVLARDVADDSRLASRDSLGEIHASSVICAPIRLGRTLYGLIHLYSTNPDNPLDPHELEFTLAVANQFATALEGLRSRETLRDENEVLRRQLGMAADIVGESPAVRTLRENIARIAPTDATVLIRGESGVGKELVARAIHANSPRDSAPFVCMNCAALSESLLESELFGHEKGSFTGATGQKSGKFEQADRGTLFLDEVGEMSLAIQAKFLRVLEGHPFERVGGNRPVQVDVRVVAATNRNLETAVEEGTFRKDLYFRLHVLEIVVEPLRHRKADIPLLARHFLERISRKSSHPPKRLTRDALETLTGYDWPGNIRELQNVVERATILSNDEIVTAGDIHLTTLGAASTTARPSQSAGSGFRDVSLDVLEQEHILATLERTNWNKSRAAQILGIERSTLDRKLKRYDVSRPKK